MNWFDDFPDWIWGGLLIVISLGLVVIHIFHLIQEQGTIAMAIGAIIPLSISISVFLIGIQLIRRPDLQNLGPWLGGWMLLGMFWMGIAGTGAVLYEYSEGVRLSHVSFLIVTFATYGCFPGLLTGWYDGTRRTQLRTIANREKQLAILSRILRHDIRNAMSVILGHAETIREKSDEDSRNHADAVLTTGQDLIELTEKERVLVETLVQRKDPVKINLKKLISNIITDMEMQYPGADFSVKGDTNYQVRAVPEIERALRELIQNGVKHNETGTPEIEIGVEQAKDKVIIIIRDNGSGLPSEEVAFLSDSATIDPINHGTGLGIQLAESLISQSNGSLNFTNLNSSGTEAKIELPLA